MRLLEHDEPIDPEIAAALDAIDAVLAGEPVDTGYAELAEVALLLSAERPAVPPELARSMDERVARRFATVPAPAAVSRRRRWTSGFWQATGAVAAGVAVIVAIVVVAGGGHGPSSGASSSSASETTASSSAAGSAASSASQPISPSAGPAARSSASSARSP